jgi:hypothetical protein
MVVHHQRLVIVQSGSNVRDDSAMMFLYVSHYVGDPEESIIDSVAVTFLTHPEVRHESVVTKISILEQPMLVIDVCV